MTFEITDDSEISKMADENFPDIHKGTQKAVLTTSELPSVHHVPFNHDFGRQIEARRQGNHSITRISLGGGVDLGATTCNGGWDPLYCCEDVARMITDFTQ